MVPRQWYKQSNDKQEDGTHIIILLLLYFSHINWGYWVRDQMTYSIGLPKEHQSKKKKKLGRRHDTNSLSWMIKRLKCPDPCMREMESMNHLSKVESHLEQPRAHQHRGRGLLGMALQSPGWLGIWKILSSFHPLHLPRDILQGINSLQRSACTKPW